MRKPSNEKIVHALKLVRERIKRRGYGFICVQLQFCANHGFISESVALYLRLLIAKRLRGCASYESWLKKYRPAFHEQVFLGRNIADSVAAMPGRLQWLDALIVEHGGTP